MGRKLMRFLARFHVLRAARMNERTMSTYQSHLLNLLNERGYIHQVTDDGALDELAARQVVPGYIGFDATAPSLHVGSLVQIMMLRRLQQTGHKPIVLMGGGTTRIGDPTGRDESRKMLSDETIAANIAGIRTVFEKLLTFGDGPTDAVMVNNHDWLGQLGYIEMLQKVGTHFTVNRMLSFDSVKLRLEREQPMTFLEFNYMILQGYDFRHLCQDMGVRLQMGGSDQWGNIVNGVELTRRMDGVEVFGLTTPLLTTADGAKMGKTAAGAVWLNEEQLPAYDFWQFWRNCDDRDVGKFLRLFTDLPLSEITRLEALEGSEINAAKVVLANEVTRLVRGEDAAKGAESTAAATFAGGGLGADLPVLDVTGEGVRAGAACTALGFTASNGEAKRKIAEGAVKLGEITVNDAGQLIELQPGEELRLSLGKKKHGILRRI
jgi:tyrosyl-tRNA synthetase